ncbi:MAG: STAS domain-containing protein [Anaerolineales bacterium]|nr:STAS domain-containing protein [Anaerolineales bacterium]
MTLRIQTLGDQVWTIAPRGRLDLPAARAMEDALNELCNAGRARVVVDLSEVDYMASAGLKALLTGLRRARLLNGDVRLAALHERVRDVFEMSGFDQVFRTFPTPDEAVQSFAECGP